MRWTYSNFAIEWNPMSSDTFIKVAQRNTTKMVAASVGGNG